MTRTVFCATLVPQDLPNIYPMVGGPPGASNAAPKVFLSTPWSQEPVDDPTLVGLKKVLAPLGTQYSAASWADAEQANKVLCTPPKNPTEWKQHCVWGAALRGTLLYVVDAMTEQSKDLAQVLCLARLVGARLVAIYPREDHQPPDHWLLDQADVAVGVRVGLYNEVLSLVLGTL
jgi:hypothetical protein